MNVKEKVTSWTKQSASLSSLSHLPMASSSNASNPTPTKICPPFLICTRLSHSLAQSEHPSEFTPVDDAKVGGHAPARSLSLSMATVTKTTLPSTAGSTACMTRIDSCWSPALFQSPRAVRSHRCPLTILQQASDTAMWASHHSYIPSATNNIEMPSYTLRIKAHTDSVDPSEKVANSQLYLSMSGLVRIKCNGKTATLGQSGTWMQTDHSGTVTILITAADMSCHTVQVEKFAAQGSDETSFPP